MDFGCQLLSASLRLPIRQNLAPKTHSGNLSTRKALFIAFRYFQSRSLASRIRGKATTYAGLLLADCFPQAGLSQVQVEVRFPDLSPYRNSLSSY